MKKYSKIFLPLLLAAASLSFAAVVHAATPALTVASTGSGDLVQVTVTGDPNATISFNYNVNTNRQTRALGSTDGGGYFTTTISTGGYGILSTDPVYVIVNGQQSSSVAWPVTSGSGTLSLSQTSVTVAAGQQITVSASNVTNSIYISSNSNPSIASATTSGNLILINGMANGSTNISVCENSTGKCGTIYVTVGSGSSQFTFSQNSVTLAVGQSNTVSVYNAVASLYISNNSNANVASAAISGNSLLLTGLLAGNTNVTVCENGLGICGTVSVSVTNSGTSAIAFSQNNLSLVSGQTRVVTAYNTTNSLYVSANSNPNVASVSLSGTNISVYGNNNGNTTITICQNGFSSCGFLYVSVGGSINTGTLSFNQLNVTNITLTPLQSVTLSPANASGSLYVSSNTNSAVASASASGSSLTITGINAGTAVLTACQSGSSCGILTINVVSGSTVIPGCIGTIGYSTLTGQSCATNTGGISGGGGSVIYVFTQPLVFGSFGEEVRQLQLKLSSLGYYSGIVDGSFGPITRQAVRSFQASQGLLTTGNVGPATRAALNRS